MLVWGGLGYVGDIFRDLPSGGRFDPSTNTWLPVSTLQAPALGYGLAVWTGTRMIFWCGSEWGGAIYDPESDSWTPIASGFGPVRGTGQVALWTGSRFLVWGGFIPNGVDERFSNRGYLYDPATDRWSETARAPVSYPYPLSDTNTGYRVSGVWTGSKAFFCPFECFLYEPATDMWTSASRGSPSSDSTLPAVWTGSRVVLWGFGSGATYDPASDSWHPMTTRGAPASSYEYTTIWTGSYAIVWGGDKGFGATSTDTGGIWVPSFR